MKTTSAEHGEEHGQNMGENMGRTCSVYVLRLYFHGNSMNNLLSYCGLIDAKIRASDKDLPVMILQK